jgi:hypothetical protein
MARKGKESSFVVNRTYTKDGKISSQNGDEGSIAVHRFDTTPAEVGITKSVTLNLGNYEFARIDVTCRVPAYIEELDEGYRFADAFVEAKIKYEIERVRGSSGSTKDASPL